MHVTMNVLVRLDGDRSTAEITVKRDGQDHLLVVRPRHPKEGEGQPWVIRTTRDDRDAWGFSTFERSFDFALNKAHAWTMRGFVD